MPVCDITALNYKNIFRGINPKNYIKHMRLKQVNIR
ncbi:MAG: hypothetical protein JWR67_3587 [Mucilaginibacter sp.]|nr:hypothetical protein [Mucilaginibacter sp.]